MAKLVIYLNCEDARSQAAFYTEALGGEILNMVTYEAGPWSDMPEKDKNKIMHMTFTAGGVLFYACDSTTEPIQRGNGAFFYLSFETEEEAYAAFDRLSVGGEVIESLKVQFWGDLFGQLKDQYGVIWQIAVENTSPSM
ncbi:hypothetical protein D3C75_374140 [compost metagenome]